jgi:hypothetical protein
MRFVFFPGCGGVTGFRRLQSFLHEHIVGDRPRVDRQAVVVEHAPAAAREIGRQVHLDEGQHLRVAVLLDHVDALVTGDELRQLRREGVGLQAQVRGLQALLARELVAAFLDRPVARPVGHDADRGALLLVDRRLRHQLLGRFELAREPIQVVLIVVGTLAVLAPRVVAGTAGEIRRHAVARNGAIWNSVAVDIHVAPELPAHLLQDLAGEQLPAVDRPRRVRKRLGHPRVHAEVEIAHDEDERLQPLGQVERVHGHGVALTHRRRDEQHVLGVAVRVERGERDVSLRGARRQTSGRPDALDVEDHARNFGVVRQPGELGHQRDARAGRGRHRARARPAGAQHHPERRDFVFRLHDGERRLPGFLVDAVLPHVADHRFGKR